MSSSVGVPPNKDDPHENPHDDAQRWAQEGMDMAAGLMPHGGLHLGVVRDHPAAQLAGRRTVRPGRVGGRRLIPADRGLLLAYDHGDVYQLADGGDLVSFLFPTYRFAASRLAQGDAAAVESASLWRRAVYCRYPGGFLYLPNLILFLFNPQFPYAALQWLAIGHLYWAGLGMYALLRGCATRRGDASCRAVRRDRLPVQRPAADSSGQPESDRAELAALGVQPMRWR